MRNILKRIFLPWSHDSLLWEATARCNLKCLQCYNVWIWASIAIPSCLIDPAPFPHVGFGFCAAGTSRAYYTIDPVGNVRPCNHTPTRLGNIFETTLEKMASSPALAAFRAARPAFCAGCRLENECLGGCKAASEVCSGSIEALEPFLELNRDRAQPRLALHSG